MESESLEILMACRNIRQELKRLRKLIGDDRWIEDENLRATDTVIYMYEQTAYKNFLEEKERGKKKL